MTQQKIAPWVYVVLVVLTAFALGYLVGNGNAQPEIVVTAIHSDVQNHLEPKEETYTAAEFPVNLNTADQRMLECLPGLGRSWLSGS